MKVSGKEAVTPFIPKTMTVTFESQEELDRWTSLFNFGALSDSTFAVDYGSSGPEIYRQLVRLGGTAKYYYQMFERGMGKNS